MNPSSPQALPLPTQHAAPELVASPYGPYEPAESGRAARVAHIVRLFCDQEHRHEMIAQAAYFRAQHRGFAPGRELEDWLGAEAEVDTELLLGPRL